MEYYSVVKRNEFESVLVRWRNLELVIQSEVKSKIEKQILHVNEYTLILEKWCRGTYW